MGVLVSVHICILSLLVPRARRTRKGGSVGRVWEVETSPSLSLLLSTSKRDDMVVAAAVVAVACACVKREVCVRVRGQM